MNAENTEKLIKEFPDFWKHSDSLKSSLMAFGFECGDGWFDLLYGLLKDIQVEYDKMDAYDRSRFYFIQVKEKWGGLRIYTSFGTDRIYDLIDDAERTSYYICEVCGKPGRLRKGGWISTLCDEHAEGRESFDYKEDDSSGGV